MRLALGWVSNSEVSWSSFTIWCRGGGGHEINAVSCWPAGVSVLIWDRNESLFSDQHEEEETSTSTNGSRSQRRSVQRSGRGRAASTPGGKLMKKKLASLEETRTKTKTTTGDTKEKQTQRRKKTWESWETICLYLSFKNVPVSYKNQQNVF